MTDKIDEELKGYYPAKKVGHPITTGGERKKYYLPGDVIEWLRKQPEGQSQSITRLVREQTAPTNRLCSVLECTKPALKGDIYCDFHRGMEMDADEQAKANAERSHGK